MSSEQQEPPARREPTSELWGPWVVPDSEGGEPDHRLVPGAQFKKPFDPTLPIPEDNSAQNGIDPQAAFREHATAPSPAYPAFRPQPAQPAQLNPASYPGYPGSPTGYPPGQTFPPPGVAYAPPGTNYPNFAVPTPSYQGYTSGPPAYPPAYPPYGAYPGFPYPYPYPYPYPPLKPKRDGYLFGVGIAAFIASILTLLGGLFSFLLLLFSQSIQNTNVSDSQRFESGVLFAAFTLIGVVGGGYGLYHSIRSAFLRKPSSGFALPTFWLFVALYAILIGSGFALHSQGQDQSNLFVLAILILLAGFLPAMAVLALGNRRLRFPKGGAWPTSWRRFTFAIVSGGTLGIVVALLLELILSAALIRGQGIDPIQCLNNPTGPACQNPSTFELLLITAAIIAPLVEEMVKPLAVIILIGRIRSAAEAFVLGLACGIGFDLIETSGYISISSNDWLTTALIRTGSGLLHGMGAAMVALGWYYLTHSGKHRFLKAAGCWLYAIAQHALWNGSWGLILLPGSAGTYFSNLSLTIGNLTLPYYEIVNIAEAIFILCFFLYMTGRIRKTSLPAAPDAVPNAGLPVG